MGFINNLFKKPKPFLNDDDINELREIEKKAYLEKAKELIKKKGEIKATKDFSLNNN